MAILMQDIENSYIKNKDRLIKAFTRMLGSPQAAEDVVQDAYERLIRYKDRYQPDDLDKWVYTVTKNCARDFLRKEKMVEGAEFDEFDFESRPFRTDLLRMKRDIKAIIKKKKESVADILDLFIFKEFTAKEIYDLTDYGASAIKLAIYRFRKEMKELYERGQ